MSIESWRFMRDEYGTPLQAAERACPELLESDPILKAAVAQIRLAEYALKGRLDQLLDESGQD